MQSETEALAVWARRGADPSINHAAWQPVAGDASGRKYFRLGVWPASAIAVLSPPATEKNREFLDVQQLLQNQGISVPAILAQDRTRGYFLQEDLGDNLLLQSLSESGDVSLYEGAFAMLLQLAQVPLGGTAVKGSYDHALLSEELSRFPQWFVGGLLQGDDISGQRWWQALQTRLIGNALEQPTVLVHRDYHSRNLMVRADGELTLIDFQDAVAGPITYDLVSLLRDCYISWPAARVTELALDYKARLQAEGLLEPMDEARFITWFDLTGLQRHIKVLGTFARLSLRDGKHAYLADLPLVIHYVREIAERYQSDDPTIAAFADYFDTLRVAIARQHWSKPT